MNRNKGRAGAARKVQTISQQDRELILFHKEDWGPSASPLHFTGIKVLPSTLNTAAQRCNLILLHRGFVDKTDKELGCTECCLPQLLPGITFYKLKAKTAGTCMSEVQKKAAEQPNVRLWPSDREENPEQMLTV